MTGQLALNLEEGRRRKRVGMALAASPNTQWMIEALFDLKSFAVERGEFVMESFRARRRLLHKPEPTSPNAWGAFTQMALKAGVIKWTGRYTQAASVKTRAHPVKVWARAD